MSPDEMSKSAHALADAVSELTDIQNQIDSAAHALAALKSSTKDEIKDLEMNVNRLSRRIQDGHSMVDVTATAITLPELDIVLFRLPDGKLLDRVADIPPNYQFSIQQDQDEDGFSIGIDDIVVLTKFALSNPQLSPKAAAGLRKLLNLYIAYEESAPELEIAAAIQALAPPEPENEEPSLEQPETESVVSGTAPDLCEQPD
jgi:hypothetical protein